MKITLPVQLQPISRRKDRSVLLKFETRELYPEEVLTMMSMEGEEGWLLFSSNNDIKEEDIPDTNAEIESKSQSQRIKAVLYKLYMSETAKSTYIGTFENYYKIKTEKYIEHLKSKLDQ